ncbi:MAG: Gfo/Idh/MocA family oxidoreductase [Candidatus Kerfeldbacteria bacterium]|nr:Gfo/Idh/MocA family oxidoreductase [Candidatus Kerfeldbacteria bacterium]
MPLKIGIVGAGVMLKYQAEGFLSAGAELTCLAETNPEAAHKAAATYNIPQIYGSLEEMLVKAPDNVDAVSVLVPPAFHKELSIQALLAGKHVLCEKPPALNAQEVAEMKRAAEKVGKVLAFDFNNRLRPESVELARRISNGSFGQINSAQAIWIRRSGIPGYGSWFTNRQVSGGGALIDLLHMVDLALYFMGYPEPICVLGQTFSDFMEDQTRRGAYGQVGDRGISDVESSAHALVTFRTGQILFLRSSWAEMVKEEQCFVTIQGQKAGGKVLRLFGQEYEGDTTADTCEIYTQEDGKPINTKVTVPYDRTMGRVSVAANFVESVEGKNVQLATPAQALRLMQIVDAVYLSAKTKTAITSARS